MKGNYCSNAINQGCAVGRPVLNAYEIAVKNGFEGTEQEWLASLKGESVTTTENVMVTSMNDNFNSII